MKLYTAPQLPILASSTTMPNPDSTHGTLFFRGSVLYQRTPDGVEAPVAGVNEGVPIIPAGMIAEWPGATPPANWLICDGRAVSRTTYSAIYSALGGSSSPWGQGDGSTTFNLPDFRGRAAIGSGTGTAAYSVNHPLGQKGGEEQHVLSSVEMNHNHDKADTGGSISNVANGPGTYVVSNTNRTGGVGVNVANPHNIMQPYTALNYIIYTGGSSPAFATDWITATLASGWSTFDATNYNTAQYMKEGNRVNLRGTVKSTSNSISTIFTLPTDFRPLKIQMLDVNAGDAAAGRVHITPTGAVSFQVGNATSWVTLDDKSFYIN